ncbi:ribonuclease II [Xylanimonas cellulosilytica DSM 15894]|uniref:Ribonuclease II n=1 Tax=Xylanimonas cellulosilytica (strain DSM 15894 / JCM 12276 / CECT 5975 / KCTC 9989 / LMG 20990 / NBRC 107835 / XIL07) TaxID=446471 RepID=D1BZW7_XYLCX|nr:RNB domain-containing ribonuclease [Xylanimonas cellulosilytica]ACZ32095.1 ribonuclease II [Xylanimonas cellulosilytica DSM 15894]
MPTRHLSLASTTSEEVRAALAALRAEIGLPAMFPPDVVDEARAAAQRDVTRDRQDRRDIDFVTIDPPGSMDLDQAVHVASSGDGYIVRYAIADVAAFVTPGSALDREVGRRGMTVYGPDTRTPLHPPVLSEGAASLLPNEDRPAALWTIGLDSHGEITSATVARAIVRSRARLTYGEAQSALDDGSAPESLQLLADVGRLRQARERDRGGTSLEVPEQEVVQNPDRTFTLAFRRTLPVEGWNAQISLLTGIAAARIMREAGVGIFRTLPPADPRDLARLRRTAQALSIDWPSDVAYPELLHRLESRKPAHAAFLNEATTLFRGAGYLAFGVPGDDGAMVRLPGDGADREGDGGARHAAIAAEYAHVTAPLRRLVDRYGTEICVAHSAGRDVPRWVADALPGLPPAMAATGRLASGFERSCVDIVEAALLGHRVGQQFDGVVVEAETKKDGSPPTRGEVVLRSPAVRARLDGEALPLGERVRVTLTEASIPERKVRFTL